MYLFYDFLCLVDPFSNPLITEDEKSNQTTIKLTNKLTKWRHHSIYNLPKNIILIVAFWMHERQPNDTLNSYMPLETNLNLLKCNNYVH